MKAMVLKKIGTRLEFQDWPDPEPNDDEVLLKVRTCGICRTDLHILDGDLPPPALPLILGHQVVGVIVKLGAKVNHLKIGDRVGVPWLGSCCQKCHYCRTERENLCDNPAFTGYHKNGGYAEYVTACADFCLPIPTNYTDVHAAPLLCAGLIGYRSYKMAGESKELGLYGFGAAAHILTQLAIFEKKNIYAFTRPGDEETQRFAKKLGAVWAGGSDEVLANRLDAAIIFAPAGELIPLALRNLRKGGVVVSAEIYMSDIPSFPYHILWNERSIRSVANLTRADGREFLKKATDIQIQTVVTEFPLEKANDAIELLRKGQIEGSAVLRTSCK